MELLARQAPAALHAAREIAGAKRRIEESEEILALARVVTGTLDLDEVLRVGSEALCRLLDASRCFVLLYDPDSQELKVRIGVGEPEPDIADVSIPVDSVSTAALCFREQRVVLIEHAETDPRVSARLVRRFREKSLMAVPLVAHEKVLGTLLVDECRRTRRFSAEEQACALLVANQLAVAVDNARLYADLRHSYSALEAAQKRLVRQERLAALGELSAVVAHEVRNPLGVIFNSLGNLERIVAPTGDGRVLFEIIREEADRINRIVRDLLDFARPSALDLREESLEKVLDEAVSAALSTETGPVICLKREIPEGLGVVLMDSRLIRQAVVNLAQNALQSMPRGGTLTLRAESTPEGLRFEIADTGVGIPPETLPRIYEPFFTTRAMGTGLGLSVVRRIVESHGGEIDIESEVGRGTTVRVRLSSRCV